MPCPLTERRKWRYIVGGGALKQGASETHGIARDSPSRVTSRPAREAKQIRPGKEEKRKRVGSQPRTEQRGSTCLSQYRGKESGMKGMEWNGRGVKGIGSHWHAQQAESDRDRSVQQHVLEERLLQGPEGHQVLGRKLELVLGKELDGGLDTDALELLLLDFVLASERVRDALKDGQALVQGVDREEGGIVGGPGVLEEQSSLALLGQALVGSLHALGAGGVWRSVGVVGVAAGPLLFDLGQLFFDVIGLELIELAQDLDAVFVHEGRVAVGLQIELLDGLHHLFGRLGHGMVLVVLVVQLEEAQDIGLDGKELDTQGIGGAERVGIGLFVLAVDGGPEVLWDGRGLLGVCVGKGELQALLVVPGMAASRLGWGGRGGQVLLDDDDGGGHGERSEGEREGRRERQGDGGPTKERQKW
ncbi:uncharacterized protein BJ171DRAFT_250004, partial [Polychytrium aggregatum]|uniref:uncharacterized protein n=1 Tax=Polychytrium aggregatum TaxID=110093 RepID=UPI0022FE84A8